MWYLVTKQSSLHSVWLTRLVRMINYWCLLLATVLLSITTSDAASGSNHLDDLQVEVRRTCDQRGVLNISWNSKLVNIMIISEILPYTTATASVDTDSVFYEINLSLTDNQTIARCSNQSFNLTITTVRH